MHIYIFRPSLNYQTLKLYNMKKMTLAQFQDSQVVLDVNLTNQIKGGEDVIGAVDIDFGVIGATDIDFS